MPDPIVLRSEIRGHLSRARALDEALFETAIFAVKLQPQMSQEQVAMRQTVLRMASKLMETEFETEMDVLTKKWIEYRRLGG